MAILFDFVTLQDRFYNGGKIFTFEVLKGLLDYDQTIFGLIDNKKKIPSDLESFIRSRNIKLIQLSKPNILNSYIRDNKIKKLFIGVSQRYNSYELYKLECEIIIFCHDVCDLSCLYNNKIYNPDLQRFYLKHSFFDAKIKRLIVYIWSTFSAKYLSRRILASYLNFSKLVKRDDVFLCTVSNYSKNALLYFFDVCNEIKVFYPQMETQFQVENNLEEKFSELKDKRFFLLVSGDRINKNLILFVEQWDRFCKITNYQYYAVIVGNVKLKKRNVLVYSSLPRAALNFLYQKTFCFVYPSFAEGFGYPPLEAMKYGIPVICSNATSLPEIYNNSVIFFNPFYPEDLFRAMIEMTEKTSEYELLSKECYETITKKQENDYHRLIQFIGE